MDDRITSEGLAALSEGTMFAAPERIHVFASLPSTNNAAMEAAAAGAPEGSVFLADEQTAGRGRGAHRWLSPSGEGLYVSVVLRPALPAAETLWLSLIAGIAMHEALEQSFGLVCDLRWPNDIMLGPKKLGGILSELSSGPKAERVRHAVVGVGLNVGQASFPEELADTATSLRIETGREWPRIEIAAAFLRAFDRSYAPLRAGFVRTQAEAIVREFEARSSYARGVRVRVEDAGTEAITGRTVGLDTRGFLRVSTPDGIRLVLSGGVRKL